MLDDRLEAEYPVWRVVLETPLPLSEVDGWGLGRVYDAIELLNMKQDYDNAVNAKRQKEFDDQNKK